MALTAGIVAGVGYFSAKAGAKQAKQDVQDITQSAQRTADALTPITPPKPPSALDDTIDQAKAMTAAARRYRMQQNSGFSSTLLSGAGGDVSTVPTQQKKLLGQ